MVSLDIIKFRVNRKTNIKQIYLSLGYLRVQENALWIEKCWGNLSAGNDFAFHDIKSIVKPNLDDMPEHSRKRIDHPDHLCIIIKRCKYYKILLNPHKHMFYVESGRLLRFIVSNKGIQVDLLKVEAIVNLPPPCSIR